MKRLLVGLIAVLVVAGFWMVVGPDGIVDAQNGCASQGAVDPSETALAADCEVLLDVRDTLAGTSILDWADDTPIGDWDGISVDGTPQRVTGIELGDSGLNGTIPSDLGNLDGLRDLNLGGNHLTGTIPSQLGNLSNLRYLTLRENQFTGSIPAQLGGLSNLEELWLWNNELTGSIPSELGNLSNLTGLWIDGNELTGSIPSELGNLSNLIYLSLWGNQLTGTIPAQLGNLSNLTYLWLDQNELRGELPNNLTGLTSLEVLTFYSNAGLCAPIDSAFQTWLQSVDNFHGSSCAPQDSQEDRAVLASLHSATDGENWENNSNWLSNQPIRAWYGVTNDADGRVTGLYLWENQLNGTIPPELGNLSEVTYLNLRDNQLTGSIPSELGNLSNLTFLFLRNNQLTGCIPAALENVEFNDFDRVGLPFCAPQAPGAPTVSVTATTTLTVRIDSPIPVTATFSEPVNGFTERDVTVANGDVSNFSGSDGDSVYTFDVTPNAVGVVTVDIAAGVAQDSDSDDNAAAEQLALGLPYDDDHDGAISASEVLAAVADYFRDSLSAGHVLQVVALYFASSN